MPWIQDLCGSLFLLSLLFSSTIPGWAHIDQIHESYYHVLQKKFLFLGQSNFCTDHLSRTYRPVLDLHDQNSLDMSSYFFHLLSPHNCYLGTCQSGISFQERRKASRTPNLPYSTSILRLVAELILNVKFLNLKFCVPANSTFSSWVPFITRTAWQQIYFT